MLVPLFYLSVAPAGGEEGGRYRCGTQQTHSCGAYACSSVENEAAAPLQNRLPYHHWEGVLAADGGKGEASFQRCPLMGFSLYESVCVESATYEKESFYNHWPHDG